MCLYEFKGHAARKWFNVELLSCVFLWHSARATGWEKPKRVYCSLSGDFIASALLCTIHAAICSRDHGLICVSVSTVLSNTEACREPNLSAGKRNNFIFDELP